MTFKSSKVLREELSNILSIFGEGVGFGGGSDTREHEKVRAELKMKELELALQTENKQVLDWIAIGGFIFAVIQIGFTIYDHVK
ncbi:MAG: hypothetical protein JNL01_01300 [Bdellovibrionales bacterium]|nr:hypothetical protein [Bdellovibrionales bacterium]